METGAIDIHHHYVPDRVVGEAKQHGKALGIEVFEDASKFSKTMMEPSDFRSITVRGTRCCKA